MPRSRRRASWPLNPRRQRSDDERRDLLILWGVVVAERVRCVHCGVPGYWDGPDVKNPGPEPQPQICWRDGRIRAHGPWIPDDDPVDAVAPGATSEKSRG